MNMLLLAVKGLLGTVDWKKIFSAVELYFGSSLPGDEKRVLVIKILKEQGLVAQNYLLNLAIEVAVAKLKSS